MTTVGEGYEAMQTPPPRPPYFYGGQSLMDLTNVEKPKSSIPCGECERRDRTIGYRETEIQMLKAKVETLEERIHEVAQIQEMRTSTAEAISLRETVRRLQATDEVQRRDLDVQYWRADSAEAKLHLHGIAPEELPHRFRKGTTEESWASE